MVCQNSVTKRLFYTIILRNKTGRRAVRHKIHTLIAALPQPRRAAKKGFPVKRTIALIILVVLLFVPLTVFAQGEDLPEETIAGDLPEDQASPDTAETEQPQETASPDNSAPSSTSSPAASASPSATQTLYPDQAAVTATNGDGTNGGSGGQAEETELPAGVPEFDASLVPDGMSAILIEASTGQILFQKNAQTQMYPASTTKLLTALVLLDEATDLDEKITVGNEVNGFSSGSSLMHLKSGHSVTVRELLYGLMLPSGNDAAAAVAVHYGGSVEGFADMMNKKAAELGMTSSNFTNPHGLNMQNSKNITTAQDMAKLAVAAHANSTLAEIMATPSYEVTSTELNAETQIITNNNVLIRTPESEAGQERYKDFLYSSATGMKTGLLQNVEGNAYYGCLVASAAQGDIDLIACMFGDTSDRSVERWNVAINLFDYGFKNLAWADIGKYIEPVKETRQISDYAKNDPQEGQLSISTPVAEDAPGTELVYKPLADELEQGSAKVEQNVEITGGLTAPIKEGQEMGRVTYTLGGEELYSAPLLAGRTVFALGQEQETKEEYALPGAVDGMPEYWWLIIVIPAAGVGAFLLIRYFMGGGMGPRPSFGILSDRKPRRNSYGGRSYGGRSYGSKGYSGRSHDMPRYSSGRSQTTRNETHGVREYEYIESNGGEDKQMPTVRHRSSTYYYDESELPERPRRDHPGRTRHKL